jgi:hypothetical protein
MIAGALFVIALICIVLAVALIGDEDPRPYDHEQE